MRRKVIYSLLMALMMPGFASAQLKQDANVDMAKALTQPSQVQSIFKLIGLNPNNFSMSHSYSMSFATLGGESYSQGLYLNTMRYKFSDPLRMYVQVGVRHQPFTTSENLRFDNQVFLSGAGIEYKPTDNMKVQFEFSQNPNAYYSPYRRSYYHNRLSTSFFDKEEDDNN